MCIGTVGLWDYTVFQSLIKIWKQKKNIIKQNRGRKLSVLVDNVTYRAHIEVCRCFTATSGRTRDCCEGPVRGLQFDIPKILKLSNLNVSPSVWLLISSVPTDWSHLVTPVEPWNLQTPRPLTRAPRLWAPGCFSSSSQFNLFWLYLPGVCCHQHGPLLKKNNNNKLSKGQLLGAEDTGCYSTT